MEEIFLRFPHLTEQIFEHLDNRSLARSREVSKTWNKYLEKQKFLHIRIIKSMIEKYDKVGEPWKKFFKYADKNFLTHFREELTNLEFLYKVYGTGLTPLHFITRIDEKNMQVWKFLIENSEIKNPRSNTGSTPLHLAAMHGCLDSYKNIMGYVVENNEDINPQDDDGETPFHEAVLGGYS